MVKGGERRQNKKARLGLDNARTAGGGGGECSHKSCFRHGEMVETVNEYSVENDTGCFYQIHFRAGLTGGLIPGVIVLLTVLAGTSSGSCSCSYSSSGWSYES